MLGMSKSKLMTVVVIVAVYAILLRLPQTRDLVKPPSGILENVGSFFRNLFS